MKKHTLFIAVLFLSFRVMAQPPRPSNESRTPTEVKREDVDTVEDLQPLGNPYLDAGYLLTQIATNQIKEIIRIINFYAGVPPESTDFSIIKEVINRNAYLKPLLVDKLDDIEKYLNESKIAFRNHALNAPSEGTPATSGILNLFSATKVADGLGTFIAERFKEELTQRYLQAFRDSIILNNTKYHYSTLLPKTYTSLLQYENVFDYKSFMTALKEAFKDDLDNLAPNSLLFVNKLKENDQIKTPDDQFYLIYYLADFIVNKIPEGQSPTSLLLAIDQYDFKDKLNRDVYGYLKVGSLIAANLVNNTGEIEPEKIHELFFDQRRLLAFAGLTIEKEKKTLEQLTVGAQSAYTLLNTNDTEIISRFIKSVYELRAAAKQFNSSKKESADIIKLSLKISPAVQNLLGKFNVVPEQTLASMFTTVGHVINLADYSKEQKYGLIIMETLSLFSDLGLSQTPFYQTFKKYGLFISNVAQAENSQQVKEALDVAALPVGSYKIKRNSFFDISLNAYPGLSAGLEFRKGIPAGADVKSVNPTLGFTVPVGLGFSWGIVKEKEKEKKDSTLNRNEFTTLKKGKWISHYITGRSHSLFVSVIDIGAITSFRLVDDDTETLPEFNWNNILAPGIYYVNGLKDTPLSWGLGFQYGPQLRSIEKDGVDLKLAESLLSVRLFLSVDIPIFNFYARTTPRRNR